MKDFFMFTLFIIGSMLVGGILTSLSYSDRINILENELNQAKADSDLAISAFEFCAAENKYLSQVIEDLTAEESK